MWHGKCVTTEMERASPLAAKKSTTRKKQSFFDSTEGAEREARLEFPQLKV